MARLASTTPSEIDRMDTSYLTQQVANIIAQLHGLFDEIGVDAHERDQRESDLFAALSDTLHNQVNNVAKERQALAEEATHLSTTIKQLSAALEDDAPSFGASQKDPAFELRYPLRDCVREMKEQYNTAQRLHQDRFDQVKKLVIALHSYSSHLEPSFVKVKLPPNLTNPTTAPKAVSTGCPSSFSLSPSYIAELDTEFTRVYEEYHRRTSSVRTISSDIINLWAELGTPDAQIDRRIIEHGDASPEQLGLRAEDMQQLANCRERLVTEKASRQKKLDGTLATIQELWERLGIDESERKSFLSAHRGVGLRSITAYDNELARLNEVKRQNMGLFVEDARCRLQALWDELFFSEEEMLAFTPAWSDVFSDALLAAHESEISRLQSLVTQRKPILSLIARHQSILADRNELEASSQDASRLMLRGQKGERRDPGKLLREEKMRKRIAKELPRLEGDLREALENWKAEHGKDFLVRGERYLDELESSSSSNHGTLSRAGAASSLSVSRPKSFVAPTSAMTPSGSHLTPTGMGTLRSSKSTNFSASTRHPGGAPPTRPGGVPARSKTPTPGAGRFGNTSMIQAPGSTLRGHNRTQTVHEIGANSTVRSGTASPSRIPARAPLGTTRDTNSQAYPPRPMSTSPTRIGKPNTSMIGTMRAPPPRMKDLFMPPSPSRPGTASPSSGRREDSQIPSGSVIRSAAPEDVYGERSPSKLRLQHYPIFTKPPQSAAMVSITTAASITPSGQHDSSFSSSQSAVSNSWPEQYEYLHTPHTPRHAQPGTGRPEPPTMISVMSGPSAAAATALAVATGGARQTSHSSDATSVSACSSSIGASALVGSENWESYGCDDEDEDEDEVLRSAAGHGGRMDGGGGAVDVDVDEPECEPGHSTTTPRGKAPSRVERTGGVDEEVSAYRRQQERYYAKLQEQRQQQQQQQLRPYQQGQGQGQLQRPQSRIVPPQKLHPSAGPGRMGRENVAVEQDRSVGQLASSLAATHLGETY